MGMGMGMIEDDAVGHAFPRPDQPHAFPDADLTGNW